MLYRLFKKLTKFFKAQQKPILVGLVLVGVLGLAVGAVLAQPSGFSPGGFNPTTGAGADEVRRSLEYDLEGHDSQLGPIGTFVARVVGFIAAIFLWIEGQIMLLLIGILLFLVRYNDFITSRAVSTGWEIVRDVANMGFILILLVIAIATILRIETYNYKRLLPKLLILAVLVNFSKLICGVFIDFAQVIMMTFVYAFAGTAGGGNFINALGLQKALTFSATAIEEAEVGLLAIVGSYAFIVFLGAVFIMVLVVILAVIVMRIVMLWLLVVLSPLAYILAAFPQGQRYASLWWSQFGKYVIIGPVLGFFLWLSLAVTVTGVSGGDDFKDLGATPEDLKKTSSGLLSQIAETGNMVDMVIALGLLIGSLIITSQMGVAGGSFAGQMAGRIQSAGLAPLRGVGRLGRGAVGVGATLAKQPFRYVGRKYAEYTPAWMQPKALYRGWQARSEELHREARETSTAKARGFVEKVLTRGKVRVPYEDQVEEGYERKYAQDFAHMTKEEMAFQAVKLEGMGGIEGRRRRRALVRTASEQGYLDDLMASEYMRKQAKWTNEEGIKHTGFEDEKTGEWHQETKLHNFLRNFLGADQQAIRATANIEAAGKRVEHEEYGGHARVDSASGKYKYTVADEKLIEKLKEEKEGAATPAAIDLARRLEKENFGVKVYKDKEGKEKVSVETLIKEMVTEHSKTPGRKRLAGSPHEFFAFRTVAGKTKAGRMTEIEKEFFANAFRDQPEHRISEHGQTRVAYMAMGGTANEPVEFDKEGAALIDKVDLERITDMYKIWPDAVAAFWRRSGGKADEKGKPVYLFKNKETGQTWNGNYLNQITGRGAAAGAPEQRVPEIPVEITETVQENVNIQSNLPDIIEKVEETKGKRVDLSGDEVRRTLEALSSQINDLEKLISKEERPAVASEIKKNFSEAESRIDELRKKPTLTFGERNELADEIVRIMRKLLKKEGEVKEGDVLEEAGNKWRIDKISTKSVGGKEFKQYQATSQTGVKTMFKEEDIKGILENMKKNKERR